MRYQNNKGQLNAQSALFSADIPKPSKGFKSVVSAVSLDLNSADKDVLEWNKKNEICETEEVNLHGDFQAKLEQLEVVKQTPVAQCKPRNHRNGPRSDLLASKAPDAFGSQLTIASDTSIASSYMSSHERRVSAVNRAFGKMTNMTTISESKQTTHCPAGYECDIVQFKKYNI